MGIHKSGGKKRSDMPLQMECFDDELSVTQLAYYNKAETEYKEFLSKAEALIKSSDGNLLESGEKVELWQLNNLTQALVPTSNNLSKQVTTIKPANVVSGKIINQTPITIQSSSQVSSTSILRQNNVTTQGSVVTRTSPIINPQTQQYQFVVDPRVSFVVGPVTAQPTSSTGTVSVPSGAVLQTTPPINTTQILPTSNATSIRQRAPIQVTPVTSVPSNVTFTKLQGNTAGTSAGITPLLTTRAGTSKISVPIIKNTTNNVSYKATEASSVGGIGPKAAQAQASAAKTTGNTSSTTPLVDLTNEDAADSKEVTFNKLSGKTFPSLVVVPRPNLRLKETSQANINQQRSYLDGKVKQVLVLSATKFTEWLIQQGLVRSEQYCSIHINSNMSPVKLKLGMYSDVCKFPYSGGYVWISDCCPQRFVSVFSGSIFEGAPHAPQILLKLIYHWSCQTNIQNITQWVKVENIHVKNFFTNLRAVCTAAVHEKFEKLGGNKKKVEVGVISLGTTSQDGNMRQVKVEVLGIMERDSKLMRLRAVEPLQDGERNYKRRFVKILEPLEQWVDKDSVILTDCTVDKGTLINMGYRSVCQVAANDTTNTMKGFSNSNIMEYLRRIVPRMFQNTLSLLSRHIIQQFLDELVWRERWGYISSHCFDSIILHLSEQTKLDTGDTLNARLSKIAANPFKNWAYANWKTNSTTNANIAPAQRQILATPIDTSSPPPLVQTVATKRQRKPTNTTLPGEPEPKKSNVAGKAAVVSGNTELTALEPYYYGTKAGDPKDGACDKKREINMKCCVCDLLLKDNISMMKHLIDHAYNEGTYLSADPTPICPYCPFKLAGFPSDFALQNHIEENHLKNSAKLLCLICEEKFRDRTNLILHMHHNHHELELPYECGICHMRSSQHHVIIDHFYETHKDGDKIQCPYCLKIVAIETNGRKMTQNCYFFLGHIQKHQRKSIARKCPKCTLWFVHKGILKDHQMKYHNTCKYLDGVERYASTPSDQGILMMPTPLESGVQTHKASQKMKQNTNSSMYTLNLFNSLKFLCDDDNMCCECEGDFLATGHFPGTLSCLKCSFSTCCNKTMQEHLIIFHDKNSKPEFNLGKVITLEKPMFCVCGYNTTSGNRLAKHLANHKRKSAYPSLERALQNTVQGQSASFPPLVTLDDQETVESWQRSYVQRNDNDNADKSEKTGPSTSNKDSPSMLNILGLVRKTSVDESSQDKVMSEGESSKNGENSQDTSEKSNPADEKKKNKIDGCEDKDEVM
uniref:C2H2-type domain-containing protein n=1 Tax=Clastoptera arizonana TaxID=38151 RepID=A0A1B6CG52_9HEMI